MTKRITQDDIAAAAHVSKATVSKALNDTGQLSAYTRRLILKTADELGYVKTANVQTPRCKTGLIGLVTSDLEGRFSNPALIGAENTLGSTNHAVLLTNSRGDPKLERAHIDQLAARRVDGLLMLGGETDSRPPLKPNTALGIPIVYAYAPSNNPEDCSVTCDNVAAGAMAIDHLLLRGRRHIAIVSGPEHYTATKDRLAGARKALKQSGLQLAAPVCYGNWHESGDAQPHSCCLAKAFASTASTASTTCLHAESSRHCSPKVYVCQRISRLSVMTIGRSPPPNAACRSPRSTTICRKSADAPPGICWTPSMATLTMARHISAAR